MLYDGDGRKTPKYTKDETKEKIPCLVALQSPPSMKWRPTVLQCLKTPKTSRTYPNLERVSNLMGQKRGLGEVWAANGRSYGCCTREIPRSLVKAGWSKGFRCKK